MTVIVSQGGVPKSTKKADALLNGDRYVANVGLESSLPSGWYEVRAKLDRTITGLLGIQRIEQGKASVMPLLAVYPGDFYEDGDLNILDYNALLDCYSDGSPPRGPCDASKKRATDFDDDGSVNQFDYNLFLRNIQNVPRLGAANATMGASTPSEGTSGPDGTSYPSFGLDGKVSVQFAGSGQAQGMVIEPDGKIVTAGFASTTPAVTSSQTFALTRHLPNGELDIGFDGDGRVTTAFEGSAAASPWPANRGKLLAAGTVSIDGGSYFAWRGYLPDGSPDANVRRRRQGHHRLRTERLRVVARSPVRRKDCRGRIGQLRGKQPLRHLPLPGERSARPDVRRDRAADVRPGGGECRCLRPCDPARRAHRAGRGVR